MGRQKKGKKAEALATDRAYLRAILTARVYDVASVSPLDPLPRLSAGLGNRISLKREDTQPVFSFKLRGAYNKMASLSKRELRRGVVTASAGNHAQGVALAAAKLGCGATIVMPVTTPLIKVQAVRDRRAKVLLHGDSYDEACQHALRLAGRAKAAFIHPYDDPAVIAGQGTVGLELSRQHRGPLHAVFVPVGGGGLAAGVAVCMKQLDPGVKVIGVEPSDSNAMQLSLRAGRRIRLPQVGLFADGVAVPQVGRETFRLCRRLLDGVLTVGTDDICAAMKDAYEDTRAILEPSGALALAGLKRYVKESGVRGQALAAVASGANMDFDRLRFAAERADLGGQKEALWAVGIPERPGSFRALVGLLGRRNITEFNYRCAGGSVAQVFVGVQLFKPGEGRSIIARLRAAGLAVVDMSGDELAKLHGRHLVGGRSSGAKDERLYRFEFPERPGALARFLDSMGSAWNLSLFHYRNQGADCGRVLAGIQVPRSERGAFRAFLRKLGYPYVDETGSPTHRLFLD